MSETLPRLEISNHGTSSDSCEYEDTGEGQNGAGPFTKESTERDGRLWRKKMSLEKRVEERMRSRANSEQ